MTAIVPLLAAVVLPGCDVQLGDGDTVTGRGPVIEESRSVGRFVVVSHYYGWPQLQQTVTGSGRVERAGG
jgi:hypothetical protein